MISGNVQAAKKDPFQPVDLPRCSILNRGLEEWQLKGALLSGSGREAIISHPLLGTKKVGVGMQLPNSSGQVIQIELNQIQLAVLPPCPQRIVFLYFEGGS
ncbi:hypothetical protein [Rosenbergiella australiborealis]|uniref:hypothetical protein n=1 Tax=Rosenbergiella australiborealis TaxID=1544696 RepID=UPI001F4D429A|nr:hypothetical protein [Rosenbergiella australiborealis]